MEHKTQPVLGVNISAINLNQALIICREYILKNIPAYICVAPAHSIMDCYEDKTLQAIFNRSGLTTPDGMAVVWILRFRGYKTVSRVYGPDLLLSMCELAEKEGWNNYFYGSNEPILKDLQIELKKRYPGLQISGSFSPPITEGNITENDKVIRAINQDKPDIIWVGLGSPKQEYWMDNHRTKLNAPLLIGVGATFDFISGNKPQAPIWIQQSGLEWLFRLLSEPTRLWSRYKKYPKFVLLVILELLGITKSRT